MQYDRTKLTRPMSLPYDVTFGAGNRRELFLCRLAKRRGPRFGAGVYTVWRADGDLAYVGMSGRGITEQTAMRNSPLGLYTRLGEFTPAGVEAAISSASMWRTVSCCRYCRQATSPR